MRKFGLGFSYKSKHDNYNSSSIGLNFSYIRTLYLNLESETEILIRKDWRFLLGLSASTDGLNLTLGTKISGFKVEIPISFLKFCSSSKFKTGISIGLVFLHFIFSKIFFKYKPKINKDDEDNSGVKESKLELLRSKQSQDRKSVV